MPMRTLTSVENCCRTPPAQRPVEPSPTAPRSTTTTLRMPSRARLNATLQPTAPAPITSASTSAGTPSSARGIGPLGEQADELEDELERGQHSDVAVVERRGDFDDVQRDEPAT